MRFLAVIAGTEPTTSLSGTASQQALFIARPLQRASAIGYRFEDAELWQPPGARRCFSLRHDDTMLPSVRVSALAGEEQYRDDSTAAKPELLLRCRGRAQSPMCSGMTS